MAALKMVAGSHGDIELLGTDGPEVTVKHVQTSIHVDTIFLAVDGKVIELEHRAHCPRCGKRIYPLRSGDWECTDTALFRRGNRLRSCWSGANAVASSNLMYFGGRPMEFERARRLFKALFSPLPECSNSPQ